MLLIPLNRFNTDLVYLKKCIICISKLIDYDYSNYGTPCNICWKSLKNLQIMQRPIGVWITLKSKCEAI